MWTMTRSLSENGLKKVNNVTILHTMDGKRWKQQ